MAYRIKNWSEFQHFKSGSRDMVWVKLYRKLLDDPDWHALEGDVAKGLVMLWLLASESEGYLPDIRKISFRLRMSEAHIKHLISQLNHWLVQDDINWISDEYQNDRLEKEKEKEDKAFVLPDWVPTEQWKAFEETRRKLKKPLTDRARLLAVNELKKLTEAGHSAAEVIDLAVMRGWQTFYPPKQEAKPEIRRVAL